MYICSFQGTRKAKNLQGTRKSKNLDNQSEVSSSKGKRKNITRTRCEASMRVRLNDEGVYEVAHHITSHNHPLTRKEWVHLHRSEREITSEKAQAIETMISSGMRAIDSFRYMVQEAEGEQSVGHTMIDHMNFVHRLKMLAIEAGDAHSVIDMLYQQSAEEKDFFFRVKLDEMGKLCNLYSRDSMMKEDYSIYGDVMIFDTTYRTNKYNLICVHLLESTTIGIILCLVALS
nr:protein FAR1-RELATED SEQUENCE 5-like [Ipomoea batatas]